MAWLSSVILVGLLMMSPIASSQEKVRLSLRGADIANNGYVDVDDIGEGDDALLCHTNKAGCCGNPEFEREGEWYFPGNEDMRVGTLGKPPRNNLFYRDRGTLVVRLNRRGSPQERGRFRCEVPDTDDVMQIVFVNIVDIGSVTITLSGPNNRTAGEIFSLVCSADIYPLPVYGPPPSFEWFFGPENTSLPSGVAVSNVTNSSNTYSSTLLFSPLFEFHTGMYICQIGYIAASIKIFVHDEDLLLDPAVHISDNGTQTAGEIYHLTCIVTGIRNPDLNLITYQWTKNNGSSQIQVSNFKTLIFSPLMLSDAGQYICEVTVGSEMYGAIEYINIEIPPPNLMSVSSNPVSPIRPIGSNVTLTCTVELQSPAVDVPVTVNVQMSDPAGSPLTTTPLSVSGSTYTTTSMISSFSREQSGLYTCRASISSTFSSLSDSRPQYAVTKVTVGVYLVLKGNIYTNNSVIFVNEIGETDNNSIRPTHNNALQCITDRSPCCRSPPNIAGEWYFPNGTVIPRRDYGPVFYRNRGRNDGTVNLNHINTTSSASTPTGLFCCILPDMDSENHTLCANIDIVILTITPFGNNIAGEIYSLECSVNGHVAAIQWFDESGDLVISRGSTIITTSSFSSQLQFSPLHQSHGGTYTCSANVNGITEAESVVLSVRVPTLVVEIVSLGIISTGEHAFSLNCMISGTGSLDPAITYQWTKNNGTQTQVGLTNNNTLSFSTLRLSDGGQYSCQVTVSSRYLYGNLNVTSVPFDIHLQVPQPVVRLVSDTPNPIHSGSSPILTCAMEFSPAVDVPVAINTVWTGPGGSTLTSAASPVMRSFTHYTSKAKLNYVESVDSGNYTCTVSIGDKTRASVGRKIVIGDGMFQLRLMYTDDCRMWYKTGSHEFELYKYHIEEALIEAIESRCECHFPKGNLLKASFSCSSSPSLTTYRNTLIGTHNFNATQLIGFFQDWVTSAPQINIKDYSVWLDSSCPVAIASLKEVECGEVRQCPCEC